jgi:hypothetical protein
MPPCAAVEWERVGKSFVSTATVPCFAASIAALSPASPEPMITVSKE